MTAVPEFERAVREVMEREGMSGEDARAALLRLADAVPDPAPTYQPGNVAIATVRGVEGVLVVRVSELWMSNVSVPTGLGMFWHMDRDVTVTSRAVVVTEGAVEELIEAAVDLMGITGSDSKLARTIREWFAARLDGTR